MLDSQKIAEMPTPVLRVRDLGVTFQVTRTGIWQRRVPLRALEGISFDVMPGETLGLIGESGSGKTTIGRAVLRRTAVTEGRIAFKGRDITHLRGEPLRRLRAEMQVVLQDPYASLNPRMRVADLIAEPLVVHGRARSTEHARERVAELLDLVSLPREAMDRYPHAFSGGQLQRIGIARALALEPDLIIADEPVSALDVSVRAQVVNLFQDLQQRLGLSYLFIAHDLAVVRHISHRVAILYAGRLVEIGTRSDVYARPLHPYTRALLAAVPIADPTVPRSRAIRAGEVPDLASRTEGCLYRLRCPLATRQCADAAPPLATRETGHAVACWNA